MLKEEEVFKKNLENEGILLKFTPDHIIWKVATNSMREFAATRPTRSHFTIEDNLKEDNLKEDNSECNHHWLSCGFNFWICDDESCGAWKVS